MFTPLRGLRLGRRAIVVGFVLAGASATAAAAASGNPIWHGADRPFAAPAADTPTTDAPVTSDAPVTTNTEPVTTVAATVPPEVAPPAVQPPAPEPPVVAAEPDATQPPVTEPPVTEPPVTEPPAPPAPPAAPEPKPNDNVVPATLSLSCTADAAAGPVSCSWSGPLPDGFASFVLLRGDPDGKGRVPYHSSDPAGTSFLDQTASAGSHSYVLVALDAAAHPLAHSNMVLIQIATT
jgi:hypothetical protein